jgi:sialate O-acetylesterase
MRRNLARLLFISAFIVLSYLKVSAEIKLPSIFTDNLVLQQRSSVSIWGWSSPNKRVTVLPSWTKTKYTIASDASGKWEVKIETPTAGGPFEISISDEKTIELKNVLIGEVWLCSGQSNMEMPIKGFKGQPVINSNEEILRSSNSMIRLYTVPRSAQTTEQENSKQSQWKEAEPEAVSNFSATSYYFGKLLYDLLHVPIGLINASYSTSEIQSWMSSKSLEAFPEIKIPARSDSIKIPFRTPTALFNGMLYPIIGYNIKGAIWYQGESNYNDPDQYEKLLPAMVNDWRGLWKIGEFSFYYAQIAPFNYAALPPYNIGEKYNSAYLRDAQRKAANKISNAAMAVLIDIGEEKNIHPSDKRTGGERLAYLALGKAYGVKGFGFESPEYDSLMISKDTAIVKFKKAPNWLTSYGKELTQFEIAGKDKVFYPAKAIIYRTSVWVISSQVKEPVAVRYAFKDFIVGDLFSTEGLPVSSFRTDNW